MDDHEKARIEEDARRAVAERGKHGSALRRYLQADEHHALKKRGPEPAPGPAPEPGG